MKVNPVSPNPQYITDEEVAKLVAQVESAELQFRAYVLSLSSRQRQVMVRFRPGGDKLVPLVINLARKNGLQVEGTSLTDIEASLAAARRVETLKTIVQTLNTEVNDMVFRSESVTWAGITLYYSLLDRMANNNPRLRAALKPVKKFFTQRSTAAKQDLSATRATRKAATADKQAKKAAQKVESIKARRNGTKTAATNGVSAGGGFTTNGVNATNGVAANGVHTTP